MTYQIDEMVDLIKKFIQEHKDIYFFLGYLILGGFYFLSKQIPKEFNILHYAIDDKIPFLPIFIIPYIVWYIYVPLPSVYLFLKDRVYFRKQMIAMFSGAFVCGIIFLIYPTMIDFRPSGEGKGILLWLTRIIYRNDTPPANCFPSLHCYEALVVHLTTFTFGPLKKKIPIRIASFVLMVLICASTLFVKQHSFVDAIGGCLIAIISCTIVNFVYMGKNYGENIKC